MLGGERQQPVEVDREAAVVDADDGPGAGSDRGGDGFRVNGQGLGLDIGEDRDRAHLGDGGRGGDEGQRGDDDLIAEADIERAQDELQRDGAVGHRYAVACILVGGEGVLEPFGVGVGMEPAPPSTPQHVEHLRLRLRVGGKGPRSGPSLEIGGHRRTAGKGKFTHVTSSTLKALYQSQRSCNQGIVHAGLYGGICRIRGTRVAAYPPAAKSSAIGKIADEGAEQCGDNGPGKRGPRRDGLPERRKDLTR